MIVALESDIEGRDFALLEPRTPELAVVVTSAGDSEESGSCGGVPTKVVGSGAAAAAWAPPRGWRLPRRFP